MRPAYVLTQFLQPEVVAAEGDERARFIRLRCDDHVCFEGPGRSAVVLLRVVANGALLDQCRQASCNEDLDVVTDPRGMFADTLADLGDGERADHEHAKNRESPGVSDRAQLDVLVDGGESAH